MQLLTNHIGYQVGANKVAVIKAKAGLVMSPASLISCQDKSVCFTTEIVPHGCVDQWSDWYFYQIDFSEFDQQGEFAIVVENDGETFSSHPFCIAEELLLNRTLSDNLFYFKGQRSSGSFDKADQNLPFWGNEQKTADVRGGWFDASGDMSKYLSHLSYANYLNPQQIPMVVWNLIRCHRELGKSDNISKVNLNKRILDEALFGADFLMRVLDKDGYFYMTIFDQWSKNVNNRHICAYETQKGTKTEQWQAAFRQGGGISIAALAAASQLAPEGEFAPAQYLAGAEQAYAHLCENNRAYCDNGKENIIDEYCALLAAIELFKATKDQRYLSESRRWAKRLQARQVSDELVSNWWTVEENSDRPYFHAAEAGLPVISLIEYSKIESDSNFHASVLKTIKQAIQFELDITAEVVNPFGYGRQYVKAVDEPHRRTAFFVAQQNESGYWWQGENARLSSLASAAKMSAELFKDSDPELAKNVQAYAQQQLNWILGLNPFDACMLYGHGHNNPEYIDGYPSAPGGICNGITSGFDNERDISLVPEAQKDDFFQNWRWGEQWIPHAAWYILAIAL
ncbi:glycoside hydrolase family 9 protein [Motilimonas sp. 1_MG-2023]|uniref:glycoside hydrolase family 9 protein n=1 Tax=Motilimonas sp. 1_MG-2023 TaxID=3062672 RepID=UPI0026E25C72|nr:glycoside hydrolase family 9 protein [Motilimonas sp. 1_MG-2023]MDO6526545.1 glycoside hydrolase family 9 protein [Motilimonas sp. 1_MG-2023]